MKLRYSFEPVDMGTEIVAVPIGCASGNTHGVLKLNRTGLEILELLANETSVDEIVDKLADKYDDDRETIEKYVCEEIEVLRKSDLLSD